MSGHSKWSTIKHKKAREDARRGKLFGKLSQKITIAARMGGSNPEMNPALALAIETARSYSMPMDNIKRAVAKGTGELSHGKLERVTFEGYGAGGVAILVETLTDNRNRTSSGVRSAFTHGGGSLGEAGCVSWLFDPKGVVLVGKTAEHDEEELLEIALEAGAEDLKSEGEYWEIVSDIDHFQAVKEDLKEAGIETESSQLTMFPKNTVMLDLKNAKKVLRLIDMLEEVEDVNEVYSNFNIPDEILDEITS